MIWKKSWAGSLHRTLYKLTWKKIDVIPDNQELYRSVPPRFIEDDGTIKFTFFQDRSGVSCNLVQLSTEEQARLGMGSPPERDVNSKLMLVKVQDLSDPNINAFAEHDPISDVLGRENYSHSLIKSSEPGKVKLSNSQSRNLIAKAKKINW